MKRVFDHTSHKARVIGTIFWALGSLAFTTPSAQANQPQVFSALSDDQSVPAGFSELSQIGDSLTGRFEVDGVRLRIETRRGPRISPKIRKIDPTAPLYEIDVRILDEAGDTYFVQYGGHGVSDELWESPQEDLEENKRGEHARNVFVGAENVISALKQVKLRNDLQPEYEAIIGVLPIISAGTVLQKSEAADATVQAYNDRHMIVIWKKPITWFVPAPISGEHSGTVAYYINTAGYSFKIWSACNHGTCPGVSPMKQKCSKVFYNRYALTQAAPNCSTAYGFTTGKHVCNDDSYIQYWSIKNAASPNTSGGKCSDTTLNKFAPSCD